LPSLAALLSHSLRNAPRVRFRFDLLYYRHMTRLLDEAIEQLRELPEEDQDAAANALFAYIAGDERQYRLQPHQVAEVQRIRRSLADGGTRLATDDEVAAVRKKSKV
jgi:hypothetical protein